MLCSKCNHELPDDSAFCQHCGSKIDVNFNYAPEFSFLAGDECRDSNTTSAESNTSPSASAWRNTSKKFKPAVILGISLAAVVLVVLIYGCINYSFGVHYMNECEFIRAKQCFDNIFVGDKVFSDKYAYIEAGVLFEQGKYYESLRAFNELSSDIPVPEKVINAVKSKIYSAGQEAYRKGDYFNANNAFNAIPEYEHSKDYLLLIDCSAEGFGGWSSIKNNYSELINLLGFENASEVLLKHERFSLEFLKGRWEGGADNSFYFEIIEEGVDEWTIWYSLPHKETEGTFYISNSIYSQGVSKESAIKIFRFTILDENTMTVYCYKDGSFHTLYRQ